jgi:hypothetical protein
MITYIIMMLINDYNIMDDDSKIQRFKDYNILNVDNMIQ